MRALRPALASLLVPALAATGCLSAPTGRDPDETGGVWPPPGEVHAIAGGSTEADGPGDLIAVTTGADAGIYLLRGEVDLSTAGATTYSAHYPIADLQAPLAVARVQSHVVVVDTKAGGRIWVLDDDLGLVLARGLDGSPLISDGDAVTIRPSSFGMGGSATFALSGRLGFVESFATTPVVRFVDPSDGARAAAPLFLDGWPGADGGLLVAERDGLFFAAGMTPPPFAFLPIRTSPAWIAQTSGDVPVTGSGGDAVPDAIGFDANGTGDGRLCVAPGAATTTTNHCLDTPIARDQRIRLLYEEIGGGGMERDVVILHENPTDGTVELTTVANLTIGGGIAVSTRVAAAAGPPPVAPGAMMAATNLDGANTTDLFVASRAGDLYCYKLTPTRLERC